MKIPEILKEKVPQAVKEREPMIVAHFSKFELKKMDQMQGGVSIDEATGLREYSILNDLIKNKQYRQAFEDIANHVRENVPLDPEIEQASQGVILTPKKFSPNPVDKVPEVKAIEEMGEGYDDELALIPVKLGKFFDKLAGRNEPKINPNTGLREYFLGAILPAIFASFAPTGASLAGTLLTKAAIGAATGALTNAMMGEDPGKGALHGGLGGVGGHFLGQALGSTLPNMFGASNPQGSQTAPANASAANLQNPGTTPETGQQNFFGNMMSGVANHLPATLGIGALMMKGHRHEKKLNAEAEAKDRRSRAALNNAYGMNNSLGTIKPFDPEYIPNFKTSNYGGVEQPQFYNALNYKTGGLVLHNVKVNNEKPNVPDKITPRKTILFKGPGKGQDDLIDTRALTGDFIVDATSTANLGDGYTDAGNKEIKHTLDLINKAFISKIKAGEINLKKYHQELKFAHDNPVPVAYSPGETQIPTSETTKAGMIMGGGNKKGGHLFQAAINQLRKHKTQNRTTIPPKAKPFIQYFPKDFQRRINNV